MPMQVQKMTCIGPPKNKNTDFQDAHSEKDSDHMEEQKEKNLDGNLKIHKEKDNNDSKADSEAEGKK